MLIKVNNYFLKYNIQDCSQADLISFYICQKKYLSLVVMYTVPLNLWLFYYDTYNQLIKIICFDGYSSLSKENEYEIFHPSKIIIPKKPFIDLIYQSLDYLQQ